MTTKSYQRQQGLKVEQQNAIDRLILGETDSKVAEAVGVHRVTVTKWRLHDPWFGAELNRRRLEVWGAAADRLRALLPQALDVLAEKLHAGQKDSVTAALGVIKVAGLAGIPARSLEGLSTEAEDNIERLVEARLKAKRARREKYLSNEDKLMAALSPLNQDQEEADMREARSEILAEIQAKLDADNAL